MQEEKSGPLTQAEKQLVTLLRSLDYGEVRVMVKENRPIRVEISKSIQLTGDK